MEASPWALREGLLYDLIGRYDHEDVRSRGVQHLAQRFHTDADQAKRVSDTALRFFNDNVTSLGLSKPEPWDNYLRWASQVAEVGLDISHNQFHKHSGYIVANCDLAGFSHEEQQRLTFLVRHHRKKPDLNKLTELSRDDQTLIPVLLVIFRLAMVLHRARTGSTSEGVTLRIEGEQVMLTAQRDWWESHGLTQADLEQEAQYLHKLGFGLLLQQSLTD
jgi:exopolyphosphatase/guanosine-5'-triphosphate,3'-diphosphate pyrophosphatase